MFETLESRRMFDASLGNEQTIDPERATQLQGTRETTIVMDHTSANALAASSFSTGKASEPQNQVS